MRMHACRTVDKYFYMHVWQHTAYIFFVQPLKSSCPYMQNMLITCMHKNTRNDALTRFAVYIYTYIIMHPNA